PPGYTPSSRPKPDLKTPVRRTPGSTTLKRLPSRTQGGCGVSRFEPHLRRARIRSSPVCAGHAIEPLRKLLVSPRAPAVLDRIEVLAASRKTPAHIPQRDELPSFRAIHADVLKGMVSYRVGFSECEHRRA